MKMGLFQHASSRPLINPAFRRCTPLRFFRRTQVRLNRGEPAPTKVGVRLELRNLLRQSPGFTGFVSLPPFDPDFFNTLLKGFIYLDRFSEGGRLIGRFGNFCRL